MTVENSKSKTQPSKILGLHVYGKWLRIFNAKGTFNGKYELTEIGEIGYWFAKDGKHLD